LNFVMPNALPSQYLPPANLHFTVANETEMANAILNRVKKNQPGYWVGPVSSALGLAQNDVLRHKAMKEATYISASTVQLAALLSHYSQVLQPRVTGLGLFQKLLALAEKNGLPVYFYGGKNAVKTRMLEKIRQLYPALPIAGFKTDPSRPLTRQELQQLKQDITRRGAKILFVGTGAPRQELWMNQHKDLPTFNVGVGNVFNQFAGHYQCPGSFWKRLGLHRLIGAWGNVPEMLRQAQRVWHAWSWEHSAKRQLGISPLEYNTLVNSSESLNPT
jgi:exopolysaccharide biosynthesis WecB/TagA/CpsF family protein